MHQHSHHQHASSKNLVLVFFLNLAFSIVEFVGAYFTNSMAVFSDAIHDFGDSAAIGVAVLLERISHRKNDNDFSYGYRRFSILSAWIISAILVAGSVVIIVQAAPKLWNPEPVNSLGMLGLAILGITVNGAAVWKLLKSEGANQKAVKLHLIEDTAGWAAVLVGSIIIYFTNWYVVDPLLSLLVAVWILWNAGKGIIDNTEIFLQAAPRGIGPNEIKSELMNETEIQELHDIHVWSLDGERNVASMHARVEANKSLEEQATLKSKMRDRLKELGVSHATIEFDHPDEDCRFENCT